MTLVKICGITNVEDALAAASAGANMLGFVFAESPRKVDAATVNHIRRILGGDVRTVGVFTDESDEVIAAMDECALDFAQLHGYQSEEFAHRLGSSRTIRAVRIKSERSLHALAKFMEAAFYLLDTYVEGVAGGTGAAFDWNIAAQATALGKPVILAGGLGPENVGEAVRTVRPFAVDVSSGVEYSPGRKDHNKIKEFIDNVREADAASR